MVVIAPRFINRDKTLVNYILNKKFDVNGITWTCTQVTYDHGDNVIRMGLVNFKLETVTMNFAVEQIQTCTDFDSLVIEEIKRRTYGMVNIETCSFNAAEITSLSMALSARTAAPTVITNTNTQKEETMSLRTQADFYARKAAEIAALAEEIENKFGTDSDYENGAILWADIIYASNADKVYNYAFIKADGKWFSTGRAQFGRTWDNLMEWFTADESKTIKAFGFAEQVYKFKTKKNGTIRYY